MTELNALHALIYGLIQGITEFLPVSSSGHLALLPHVFSIKDPGVVFDLLMHLGTAIAVLIYFWRDIKKYFPSIFDALFWWKKSLSTETVFLRNFIITNLGTFFGLVIIKPLALSFGRSPLMIASNLAIFGLLLIIADKIGRQIESPTENFSNGLKIKKSLLLGIAQAIALFPGVSRSGVTISAARVMRMPLKEASYYSFLLSIPIILAGCALKILDLVTIFFVDGQVGLGVGIFPLVVGILSSFAFGYMTIHFFLKSIQKWGLVGFGIYRIILAGIIYYLGH